MGATRGERTGRASQLGDSTQDTGESAQNTGRTRFVATGRIPPVEQHPHRWEFAGTIEAAFKAISEHPGQALIDDQAAQVEAVMHQAGISDTSWVRGLFWSYKRLIADHDGSATQPYEDSARAGANAGALPSLGWAEQQVHGRRAAAAQSRERNNRGTEVTTGEQATERATSPGQRAQPERREDDKRFEEPGKLERISRWLDLVRSVAERGAAKNLLPIIRSTIEIVNKVKTGEMPASEMAKYVFEAGEAVIRSAAWIMELMAHGNELAEDAAEMLGGAADVIAVPAAVIDAVDQVSILARGKHVTGKIATQREIYLALFDLGRDAKSIADGANVVAQLSPRLAAFFEPAANALGWANPIAIGAEISYEELKFLTAHVYGPSLVHLQSFLSNLRTGSSADQIAAGIQARPVDNQQAAQDFIRDVAPYQLGGNGSIFGQGDTGWGWLGNWTARYTAEAHHGVLAPYFVHLDATAGATSTKLTEPQWISYAHAAKSLALRFIAEEKAAGKVK